MCYFISVGAATTCFLLIINTKVWRLRGSSPLCFLLVISVHRFNLHRLWPPVWTPLSSEQLPSQQYSYNEELKGQQPAELSSPDWLITEIQRTVGPMTCGPLQGKNGQWKLKWDWEPWSIITDIQQLISSHILTAGNLRDLNGCLWHYSSLIAQEGKGKCWWCKLPSWCLHDEWQLLWLLRPY